MKKSLYLILFSISLSVFSQENTEDTLFYRSGESFVSLTDSGRINANGFSMKLQFNPNIYTKAIFYLQSGTYLAQYECYDFQKLNSALVTTIKNGKYEEWHENGQKRISCTYKKDILDGEFLGYYSSGKLKRYDLWKNGELKKGICYDENGNTIEYCAFEEMPEYPGGTNTMLKFIAHNIIYPPYAMSRNISGRVFVSFIVSKEGKVEDIKIAKGVEKHIDEEALRVIGLMENWKPGKIECKPVNVKFNIPINFRLR